MLWTCIIDASEPGIWAEIVLTCWSRSKAFFWAGWRSINDYSCSKWSASEVNRVGVRVTDILAISEKCFCLTVNAVWRWAIQLDKCLMPQK